MPSSTQVFLIRARSRVYRILTASCYTGDWNAGSGCRLHVNGALGPTRVATMMVLSAGIALAGCSIAVPISPLMEKADVTGSVRKPQRLASMLSGDDLHRAQAALDTVLRSDGKQQTAWENPRSGTKGTFKLVSADDSGTPGCRAFAGEIFAPAGDPRALLGAACPGADGSWTVTDMTDQNGA